MADASDHLPRIEREIDLALNKLGLPMSYKDLPDLLCIWDYFDEDLDPTTQEGMQHLKQAAKEFAEDLLHEVAEEDGISGLF